MTRRGDAFSCDLLTAPVPPRDPARPLGDMANDDHDADERKGALERPAEVELELLYRDQAPALRRRLRARLGSSDAANDLVQDAFARLVGARPADGFRNHAAFLNRIVRNLLIDRSRRLATRAPHVPLAGALEVAVQPDQADGIELEQMRSRYRELVAALPERMREVFMLHRVQGLAYKEIAARLDISVRTVEWHIAEAIVRISRGLDRE